MNPNPEEQLQRFRLPAPAPELRAHILAAAREEWQRPAPASDWVTLRRPLLAVAASLVLLAAGGWANQRLAAPATFASARPADSGQLQTPELPGLPPPRFITARTAPPTLTAAALQARHDLLNVLMDFPEPRAIAPNGQSRLIRQIFPSAVSCC
ncbi:MAG: hypothetical protein PHI39_08230 [Kiritimatiellae bacterium]|nr:hypothetical protein [Kiritimatiellia bacterium]